MLEKEQSLNMKLQSCPERRISTLKDMIWIITQCLLSN